MPFGAHEVQNVRITEFIGVREFRTELWHFESEKEISFAILSRSCFEESPSDGRLFGSRGLA